MIDAAIKALSQMFSPPFRSVLIKSIAAGAGHDRAASASAVQAALTWLTDSGATWAEGTLGCRACMIRSAGWSGSCRSRPASASSSARVFLMPAVTAFVGSFFVDEIAEQVERAYYRPSRPARRCRSSRALIEGIKTALLAMLVYLVALPFLLFAGLRLRHPVLRHRLSARPRIFRARRHALPSGRGGQGVPQGAIAATVFAAGLLIAAFVSIPIVNLATPLFAHGLHGPHAQAAVGRARRSCWNRRDAAGCSSRPRTVFPGQWQRSAITHFSHSGLRATQV